jgi:hypothetical protein
VFCREECYENIVFRKGNENRKYTVPSAHADPQQGNYYNRISLLDCLFSLLYQKHTLPSDKDYLYDFHYFGIHHDIDQSLFLFKTTLINPLPICRSVVSCKNTSLCPKGKGRCSVGPNGKRDERRAA